MLIALYTSARLRRQDCGRRPADVPELKYETEPATTFALFLFLLAETGKMPAQEPAFFAGMHAIRYEENPGYFHFVFPCNQVVGATTQTETPGTPRSVQPALCWPVRMVRSATVDGKTETAPYVDGLWQVSASTVRVYSNRSKRRISKAGIRSIADNLPA